MNKMNSMNICRYICRAFMKDDKEYACSLMVFKFQVYGVSTDHTAWTNYMVKLKTQGFKQASYEKSI